MQIWQLIQQSKFLIIFKDYKPNKFLFGLEWTKFYDDVALQGTTGLLDALNLQKADVLGYSMGSFVAQQLTLLHPEKVNRLILYAASCGGEQAIPESPDVANIFSDVANNRLQDITKFLSVIFPQSWIQSHPNSLALPQKHQLYISSIQERERKMPKCKANNVHRLTKLLIIL